jgi:hypothetical protein
MDARVVAAKKPGRTTHRWEITLGWLKPSAIRICQCRVDRYVNTWLTVIPTLTWR